MTEAFKQGFMDKMAELKKEAGKFSLKIPGRLNPFLPGRIERLNRSSKFELSRPQHVKEVMDSPLFGKKLREHSTSLKKNDMLSQEAADITTHFWNDVAFPMKEEQETLTRLPDLSRVSVEKLPADVPANVEGRFDHKTPEKVYMRNPVPGHTDPSFLEQFGRLNHELGHRFGDGYSEEYPFPFTFVSPENEWRFYRAAEDRYMLTTPVDSEIQAVTKQLQAKLYADYVLKTGKYPTKDEFLKWLDDQPGSRFLDEYGKLETSYTWPTKRPNAPTYDEVLALEKAKDDAWEKYFQLDSNGETEEILGPARAKAQEAEKLYSKADTEYYNARKVRTFEDSDLLKGLVRNMWAVGPVAAGLSENEDKAGD